jgi:outer membrane lipoprotein-sorting protein
MFACGALLALVGAAHADEKADALIRKARQLMEPAKTFQGTLSYSFETGQQRDQQSSLSIAFRLMKPNYGSMELKDLKSGRVEMRAISDGKTAFQVEPAGKQYRQMPASPQGIAGFPAGPGVFAPLALFFSSDALPLSPEAKATGTETQNGKSYQVVEMKSPEGVTRHFFAADGMLEGVELAIKRGETQLSVKSWLKSHRLNAPMTAQQFAFKPPAGFRPVEQRPSLEGSLVQVGKKAPDFELPVPGGGRLSLTAAREGKKAVLVNFWFYH